jgi:WD40 repeat protein
MTMVEELIAANPFPGLRAFQPGEADRFFGREQQIEELARRLGEVPLLAVAGASGCGKSSLMIAGLLHYLTHQTAEDGGMQWRPVRMRPGNHPINNLADGLAAALPGVASDGANRAAALDGRLRLGGRALVEAVRTARLEPNVRLLVAIDQFEEIFRFKRMTDPEEATAFVRLLLHAAWEPNSRVSVVLTLRSDALGSCADFRDLPEAINRGQYLVPKLTREQRREAIVKPVELRSCKIAPRLVQRILNDVTDDFDDLPIMQHVLTRTWQCWAAACRGSRPIDLVDYEATGGGGAALSNHADEAYTSLTGLSAVVERVFRALTERIAEGTEIRRPLAFEQLCAVTGRDRSEVEQVVERFRRPDTAFLMPSQDVALATNPVIDISHESLMRQWRRLREWTQREAESRAELLRLVEAARLYARGAGDLWRGRDLDRVLEWREGEQPTAAWVGLATGGDGDVQWQSAQTFLADSRQTAEHERKSRRRLRLALRGLAAGVVVVTLAASVVTGLEARSREAAEQHARKAAEAREATARSNELANLALLEFDQDPARSAYLARAAFDRDHENKRAEYALRQAIGMLETAHSERIKLLHEPITDARLTQDGSRLVVASAKHVTIFDTQTYETIGAPFARDKTVLQAWLIAGSTLLLTLTDDGQAQIQQIGGGNVRRMSCAGNGNFISALAVSTDEQHIAAGCFNGEIAIWNISGADVQQQPSLAPGGNAGDASTVTALNFSADNEYLATGDASGGVMIWKLGQSGPWIGTELEGSKKLLIQQSKAIRDVCFHPTYPELLATASDDGTAIVWRLDLAARRLASEKKGEKTKWVLKHDRPVTRVQFTPRKDSEGSLMTIADKRVYFWTSEEDREIRTQDDWVLDANVSNGGEFLASASSEGTARVYSTRAAVLVAVLRGHRDSITHALILPHGEIVTTSMDGSLRVWRVHPSALLASSHHWVLSAAFDPAGKRVALCGERECSLIEPEPIPFHLSPEKESLWFHRPPEEERLWSGADRNSSVSRLSWSGDGKFLLGLLQTNDIHSQSVPILWEMDSRREVTPNWLKQWRAAAFSAGASELVTMKVDGGMGTIAVWDSAALQVEAPQPKRQFGPVSKHVWAELSPDGRWVAVVENENEVALWDLSERESAPRILTGHRGIINSVQFSDDSNWVVTASNDRTARVWRVDQPADQPQGFVELAGGHREAVSFASFNRDGRQVVTSSSDGTIRVWDAGDGRELGVLRWHSDGVNEVRFDLEGKQILSASDDGTVRLGQCGACNDTIDELRAEVGEEAVFTPEEMEQLQRETQ